MMDPMPLGTAKGGVLPNLIPMPASPFTHILFALGFALIWDLWQYWVHRWQHTSPFLWQTHKLHHSDRALNSTTQARHHATHYLLFMILYSPLLVLFGTMAPHAIAAFLMFQLWGFVDHANVRVHLGPVTPVVAGPLLRTGRRVNFP